MLRADLHVHTCYSPDSISSTDAIVERCLKIGIDCLAVTDHNSIRGALELRHAAPFTVIVGEEVLSSCGEIIGLFLTEEIPRRLTPEETVAQIKGQGGLVCIPHPFDRFRPHSRLRRGALERIASDIDMVEVFNSRTLMLQDSARALEFARSHSLPGTVGSDAHVIQEIGKSYIELPEFSDARGFLASLGQGRAFTSRTSPLIHFANIRNRLVKRLQRRQPQCTG